MANIDEVLSDVQSFFDEKINTSEKIKELYRAVRDGTATYTEANEYALEVGNLLAKAYKNKLPTDKLYEYEEALGLLKEPLHKNYEMIAEYCETVQKAMNQAVGMNLNAVKPPLEEERIQGIAKAVSEADTYEKTLALFDDPIQTFSQHVVDTSVRENAAFHSEIGLKPKIIRKYEGGHFRRGKFVDCKWCKNLAGIYDYELVKNKGNDVYRRHAGCRCTIEYDPGNGKKVNVITKKSIDRSGEMGYINSPGLEERMRLKRIYDEDVEAGWISPNASFENYYELYNRIQNEIVGRTTVAGTVITSQSRHFMQRVLGTMVDPKKFKEDLRIIRRSGTELDDIMDALFNGRARQPNGKGLEKSQLYYGKNAHVTVNPDTGKLIQCNPAKK